MEDSDYSKLVASASELWLRSLIECAYTWGNRKSELLKLKVRQVDLANGIVRLNPGETKNGKGRVLPMTQAVYTLLAACINGKQPQDFVFTYPSGAAVLDFRERWARLTREAGRPGLLFHDLRRSAVRNIVRRGIPEVVAMELSGHLTREVFNRYNIVSESGLKDAARKIEAGKQVHSQFNGKSDCERTPRCSKAL